VKLTEALVVLGLKTQEHFNLIQLKEAYRRELKLWHPDLNPHRLQEATVRCQQLNAAYDLLETTASARPEAQGKAWESWLNSQLPKWEKEFKALWRSAYQRSCGDQSYPGLHFSTCIINFKRMAIAPRPEWFRHCLFKDTPESRTQYREHLLKIAPNQKFREEWARKYFALEFDEGNWVFYLPPAKELLTAASYAELAIAGGMA
jgi:hypothetical protein